MQPSNIEIPSFITAWNSYDLENRGYSMTMATLSERLQPRLPTLHLNVLNISSPLQRQPTHRQQEP